MRENAPELGLGAGVVKAPELHAEHLGARVRIGGHVTAHDVVLVVPARVGMGTGEGDGSAEGDGELASSLRGKKKTRASSSFVALLLFFFPRA